MRPKRKAWEDTIILLRPWGQISNETRQRKTCRRERTQFLLDPPQAKSRLASPWRATGLGPGAGCLPSWLSPCPWLGSFSLPLQSSPPCPLPPSSLALTSSALGSLTHCFPSSLPSLPPSPGSGASPSPEGALATRVPAFSSPWAPAPLCAKEAPYS